MEIIVSMKSSTSRLFKNLSVAAVFFSVGASFLIARPTFADVPRGPFCLGNTGRAINDTALNNPDIIGVSIRYGWMDLEASEGVFDWSFLDSEVARAATAGKQVLLRIGTMAGRPAWVTTAVQNAGGKFFTFMDGSVQTTIPVFWDPTFLAKKSAMITALGAHFTNNPTVTIVCASFANATSEDWNVPHTGPDVTQWLSLGYTSDKMLAAGQQIIDTTMRAFPNQLVTLAVGGNGHVGSGHDLDPTADYVARNAVDTAQASWPGRLIVQVNSISTFMPAAPGDDYSAWRLLWDSQPIVAGQMVYRCVNDPTYRVNNGIPIDPAVALRKSINNGLEYGIKYLEIYQTDVINLPAIIRYAHDAL
jgi:hypothetical protein